MFVDLRDGILHEVRIAADMPDELTPAGENGAMVILNPGTKAIPLSNLLRDFKKGRVVNRPIEGIFRILIPEYFGHCRYQVINVPLISFSRTLFL